MDLSRLKLAAFSCLAILGCGTQVSRDYIKSAPIFFITPPSENIDGLQIQLSEQISDAGEKTFQVLALLKNSADADGKLWSDLFGNNFSVQLGVRNIQLNLQASSNEFLKDLLYSSGNVSVNAAQVSEIFGNSAKLLDAAGTPVSTEAHMPLLLDDASGHAPALSARLLASCKFSPSDPAPGLSWMNQNNENILIQIGASPTFSTSVSDSGSWFPVRNFYEAFYSAADLNTADQSRGTTGELVIPARLTRTSSESMRVTVPKQLDRSLVVVGSITQIQNIRIQYVGGCRN